MNLAVDTMEQERLQGWLTVANSETGKRRSFVVIVLEIIFQSVCGYWRHGRCVRAGTIGKIA